VRATTTRALCAAGSLVGWQWLCEWLLDDAVPSRLAKIAVDVVSIKPETGGCRCRGKNVTARPQSDIADVDPGTIAQLLAALIKCPPQHRFAQAQRSRLTDSRQTGRCRQVRSTLRLFARRIDLLLFVFIHFFDGRILVALAGCLSSCGWRAGVRNRCLPLRRLRGSRCCGGWRGCLGGHLLNVRKKHA
jgi:hypothetical protein